MFIEFPQIKRYGGVSFTRSKIKIEKSMKIKLDDIKKATEGTANLICQLLAFSRREVLNLKVINLNSF
jgi:S-adenosylhomocysteine hydrolase